MNDHITVAWTCYHIFQVCVFQLYALPKLTHLAMRLTIKRNPQKASELGINRKYMHAPQIDFVIGLICIALILTGHYLDDSRIYGLGHYGSVILFLATGLVLDCVRALKLKRVLPLKDKRQATLVPRDFASIVPLWAWGIYLLFTAVVFTINPGRPLQLLVKTSTVIILLAVAWATDKRSPVINNTDDDDNYRRSEAWTIYAVAWTVPIVFGAKNIIKEPWGEAIFAIVPLICFILFLNSSIYKKLVS